MFVIVHRMRPRNESSDGFTEIDKATTLTVAAHQTQIEVSKHVTRPIHHQLRAEEQ